MDEQIHSLIRKYNTNCPFELAGALGIQVNFSDLGSSTRGLYFYRLKRRFIVINNDLNSIWKRFVCAHELAHDRLHPGFNRFWLDQNSLFNPGKYEFQANKFAFDLLSAGKEIRINETIREFCIRSGIPEEMHKYYLY